MGVKGMKKIKEVIEKSLQELHYRDKILLEIKANERSITHKLACYIDKYINEIGHWDVDAEYNRSIDIRKSLNCPELDFEQEFNYPDIIIHKRGKSNYNLEVDNHNLLIIELKVNENNKINKKDFKKIQCFIKSFPYYYNYGLFINLNTRNKDNFSYWLTYFKKIVTNREVECEEIETYNFSLPTN